MMAIQHIEEKMIRMVNHERIQRGLKKLAASPLLSQIARHHSQVQLQHRDIFHESPVDGSDHGKRIVAGRYLSKNSAENVSTAPTLEMSHNGLMNSKGHFMNIVGEWEEIGIGIVEDKDGQLYVTQLFANPVRIVNTELLKAKIREGLYRYRKSKKLNPISHISSKQLQNMAETQSDKLDNGLFNDALEELSSKGILYHEARIFQFTGFSNPSHEEQLKLASLRDLKAISLAFHQNMQTGMLKGVLLFLM